MRLPHIVAIAAAALAITLPAIAGAGDIERLTDVAIDREAELYTARLNGLPIAAQPYYHASLAVLVDGDVTIITQAHDEIGVFTQCMPSDQGDQCTDWVYWATGPTHHVLIPMVTR